MPNLRGWRDVQRRIKNIDGRVLRRNAKNIELRAEIDVHVISGRSEEVDPHREDKRRRQKDSGLSNHCRHERGRRPGERILRRLSRNGAQGSEKGIRICGLLWWLNGAACETLT